jgi:enoyl-CoA hydratase/carnithine racemase
LRDVGILGKRYPLADAVAAGIFDACVPAVSLMDRSISTAQQWAAKSTKRRAMSLIKKGLHADLIKNLNHPVSPQLFPKAKL